MTQERRPNILHILTDQQRFDTIHALGNAHIRTPALDRLVREGTTFTNAFTPSPVCVPARCSMIYGQYPLRTACTENWDMPADGRQSLMDVLTAAGYRTHGVGKCHFMPDMEAGRGFESRESQEGWVTDPARDDYVRSLREEGYDAHVRPFGAGGSMYYIPQPSVVAPVHHQDSWVATRSSAFLSEQAGGARPWYLFCSFLSPHPPFCPPRPWHQMYHPLLMPLPKTPPNSEALLTWVHAFQNRYKFRDAGTDLHLLRTIRAYYYAGISYVDYLVGTLLSQLEEAGQLDNTLVLFTSDHGEYLGDYGCYGKRGMHDVSARVPLLCRLPGRFAAGARVSTPASLVDVLPTFASAAGATLASHAPDGVDLAALARGDVRRDTVFSQYDEGDMAIFMAATERWKYIYSVADRREYLFDRLLDPEETRNVADNGIRNGVTAVLRERTHGHIRESGGEERYLDGKHWRAYETQTVHRAWKWWPMRPPRETAWNPDSGFLMGPYTDPGLPEGYQVPDSDGGTL